MRYIPLDNILNKAIKRGIDIIGSLLAIIIFSPIMIIIAILIKLTSKGPLIFKQERIGLNRKPFIMYKFRSMREQDPEEEKKIAFNQKIVQIKNAVQKLINDTAASKDYDDGFTCVSYFNSTDETFKAEARAFNFWRDQLWRKCYEILDDVLAGKIDSEQVNVDYVLNLLPKIEW